MERERLWPWVLRLSGLAGVIYETIGSRLDRPGLLLLFGAMMGLADGLDKLLRR